ncbi:MAG TPA: FKBP-type peptidyl-prolyl cis-trans isomerase [Gemmatimonadaceae bacterium]|nr:FKBP-type peptidyl-prolyl cis-trans isomerase [Gemmatimonadaceae bacterium]
MSLLRRSLTPLLAVFVLAACSLDTSVRVPDPIDPPADTWNSVLDVDFSEMTKLSSGVYIRDDQLGTGESVTSASTVSIFYSGYLPTGYQFDSNVGGDAYVVPLAQVVPGLRLGMEGMQPGGKRRIIIPGPLGYPDGNFNAGIPANSNLLFDIEFVDFH